jgi:hypothetical protein
VDTLLIEGIGGSGFLPRNQRQFALNFTRIKVNFKNDKNLVKNKNDKNKLFLLINWNSVLYNRFKLLY